MKAPTIMMIPPYYLLIAVEGEYVKRLGATLNTVFHEKQRQQKV